jgi:uncharacterized membrane protein YfcA
MDASTFTPATWALLFAAAFLQGLSKGGMPGVSILAIPLVAMVIPGKAASGMILPMLILGDVLALAHWHRSASWRDLRRALPWAVAGIVAGTVFIGRIDDRLMRPIIGWVILLILLIHVYRLYLAPGQPGANPIEHPLRRRALAACMGTLGGFTTMLANAAGPVMTMHFLARRLPKETFLGTSAWFFFLVNWIKVPFMLHLHMITLPSLKVNLLMTPALLIGVTAGVFIVRRINQQAFDLAVILLTALACVRLLL